MRWIKPQVEVLEDRIALAGAIFTVTNNGDDGSGNTTGTLSWAIIQANFSANNTINFAIGQPGSSQVITLTGTEPTITEPMLINGLSQGTGIQPYIGLNGTGVNGEGLIVKETKVTAFILAEQTHLRISL